MKKALTFAHAFFFFVFHFIYILNLKSFKKLKIFIVKINYDRKVNCNFLWIRIIDSSLSSSNVRESFNDLLVSRYPCTTTSLSSHSYPISWNRITQQNSRIFVSVCLWRIDLLPFSRKFFSKSSFPSYVSLHLLPLRQLSMRVWLCSSIPFEF